MGWFFRNLYILLSQTQGERLQAFPHMLINTMNLGIVIDMVNGWTWDIDMLPTS
jgi:hypothetical protein